MRRLTILLLAILGATGAMAGAVRAQSPGERPAAVDLRVFLRGHARLEGEAREAARSWPMLLAVISLDSASGALIGRVEWPSLLAVHRIEGTVTASHVTFREVAHVLRGNGALGCRYDLELGPAGNDLVGTWGHCPTLPDSGEVRLRAVAADSGR